MTSKHASVGDSGDNKPLEYIFIEDKQKRKFKLVIDSRLPHLDSSEENLKYMPANEIEMSQLVAYTIGNWTLAMRAYLFGYKIQDDENIRAIFNINLRNGELYASDNEPYVTVWNYSLPNAPKIAMNSQSRPREVAALTKGHVQGIALFNKHANRYGIYRVGDNAPKQAPKPPNPPTPTNVTDIPIGNPQTVLPHEQQEYDNKKSSTFPKIVKSNIRKSKWLEGVKTHLRLQEFVQGGGEKYDKTLLIASLPFNRTTMQYEHKQKVAFKVIDAISVIENKYQDEKTLQITIPITGGLVYVKIEPGNDKAYYWKALRDALGLQKEQVKELAVGQKLFLGDVYLVLQCSSQDKDGVQLLSKDGQAVQYKNFYNLYYSPEE